MEKANIYPFSTYRKVFHYNTKEYKDEYKCIIIETFKKCEKASRVSNLKKLLDNVKK